MLKSVTITNYRGESVVYKIEGVDVNDNNGLLITSIDGLGPVKADINMTELVTSDGSVFNSARLESRNIVIEARFTNAKSIEDARQMSYKFFPIKKRLTIRVETDNRIAETTGYVESNEPNIFSDESDVQISILCESAFFYSPDKDVTTFSGVDPKFEFVYENEDAEQKQRIIINGNLNDSYDFRWFNSVGQEVISPNLKISQYTFRVDPGVPYIDHGHDIQGREVWYVPTAQIGKLQISSDSGENYYDLDTIKVMDEDSGAIEIKTNNMIIISGTKFNTNFGDIIFKKVASVTYTGDSEVGCIIELHAIGTATNVTVYNMYTGERMRIDTDKIAALTGSGIIAGDTITICTIIGKKSITLLREGVNINILNALSKNTDWITLSKGDNVLGITADYGDQNIQFTVTSQVAYEGV